MNQVVINNIRFSILDKYIVRIEFKENGKFYDKDSFYISNRQDLKGYDNYKYIETENENSIIIDEYKIVLSKKAKSFSTLKVYYKNKKVYHYKPILNCGELPLLESTPIVFPLMDNPRITLPSNGYKANGGKIKVNNNAKDIYLFLINKDFELLRKLFTILCGKVDMVRLSTLGYFDSRYYEYNQQSAMQNILDYKAHNCPIDNMVIDTDWRESSATGIGYNINKKLFPDMKGFLDFAHSQDVEIMFNDHPEPCKNVKSLFSNKEMAFRENKLTGLLKIGLDYWWYDRNWMTHLISPTKLMPVESFGEYAFTEITRNYFKNKANDEKIYRRPIVMSNASEVFNGHYKMVMDSASHRNAFQWTGDISTDEVAIYKQLEIILKASSSLISYINFDCGGHSFTVTRNNFIRWSQLATFSPIYRPHCTKDLKGQYRQPWIFDKECEDIVINYINMRYHLMPIIYKGARKAYDDGTPIFKEMGFNYKNDIKALKCKDQIMLDDSIIAIPISNIEIKSLDKSNYKSKVELSYFDKQDPTNKIYSKLVSSVDYYVSKSLKNSKHLNKSHLVKIRCDICFDKDVTLFVESVGQTKVYIDNNLVSIDNYTHSLLITNTAELKRNTIYSLLIENIENEEDHIVRLYYKYNVTKRKIYLPEGTFIDLWSGKEYKGKRYLYKKYPLNQLPLFVKKGSLLTLARTASSTKTQYWNDLVFDYYPSKEDRYSNYIYEDDTYSTAYKYGKYKICKYESYYDNINQCYVIKLFKAEGSFEGNKNFDERKITFKVHKIKVNEVLFNQNKVNFKTTNRKDVYPFNDTIYSKDSKTSTFTVNVLLNKENIIIIK